MKFFMKFLALINMVEGLIHFVTGGLVVWGIFSLGRSNWQIGSGAMIDILLGIISIFTAYVLGIKHHHHKGD